MKKKTLKKKVRINHSSALFCVALGSFCSIIILFAILAVFSSLLLASKSPHPFFTPLSFFAIYSSAFFGGFIAVKKNYGKDALLCGTLTGVVSTLLLCLLFLAVGAILKTQSPPSSWIFRTLAIAFSTLGGLLATKSKASRKKKKRRKQR